MSIIDQYYHIICQSKYSQFGFCRYKNTYARILNSILQTFSFVKSNPNRYNIQFGIIPLSSTIISLDMGVYSLNQLYDDISICSYGWMPNNEYVNAEQACIFEITEAVDRHLMPLFMKCSNSNDALDGLIKLEEKIEANRKSVLSNLGRCDRAILDWQVASLFDPHKFYLAIGAKDYNYMRCYLEYMISYYDRRIRDIESGLDQQPESVYQSFKEDRDAKMEQAIKLAKSDFEYFNRLVVDKEKKTVLFLKSKYPCVFGTVGSTD